ncbi:MAG: sugar ABC transporter ATP-binding protein [Erysipelotrichaceae bacterium]|nr:sugar ABC transporter ATP-binding protein [Erysipelotrichaceae bacterium]MBO4538596.1 sugar ABC transporter ATP-binding protein [Erysipelotrichaceae bacterium]
MSEYVLEMKNICKAFPGVQALYNANLSLKPGHVHALMGENGAGKSTLMKCLFGIYKKDSGEIIYQGQEINNRDPFEALNRGIAMVHQELLPIPDRTIAENIYVGRYPVKKIGPVKLIDHKKMYRDAQALLDELNLNFDAHAKLQTLTASQMQLVEICKALSADAKIVILDEPTSSLTLKEVDKLFEIIRQLTAKGCGVIYISHKMDEILQISDEITIMRDGQYIGTWEASEMTTDMIIEKEVGRELKNLYPPKVNTPGEVVFEVKDFCSIHEHSFQHCSFEAKDGEILGVAGLVGAQRTELMEAIMGLRGITSGEVYFKGKKLNIKSPSDAISEGVTLLTEDRRGSGIFGVLSVGDNVGIASVNDYLKYRVMVDQKKINQIVDKSIGELSIKTPSKKTQIQHLSGGNQQKVIISRWLAKDPEVLIMDEPTRGIDVGAKYEIYSIIGRLAKEGKTVIMVSSEMPELIGVCDRIMVMCEGQITGFVEGEDMNQEKIMELSTKFSK